MAHPSFNLHRSTRDLGAVRLHGRWRNIWVMAGCLFAGIAGGSVEAEDPITGSRPAWTVGLPACPCRRPNPNLIDDGWAVDPDQSTKKYHPGATICHRSYPPVKTDVGRSGQQCCYDVAGALIVSGSAAGTPDKATSARGERKNGRVKVRIRGLIAHILKDVRPFKKRGSWKIYIEDWPPDNANGCPFLHVEGGEGLSIFSWRSVPIEADVSEHAPVTAGAEASADIRRMRVIGVGS